MFNATRADAADSVSAAHRPFPSKLFVEVTTRCNLDCAMCVKQAPGNDIGNDHMTPDVFERLEPAFSKLQALVLNGVGEPLLNPHLESYIRSARSCMPHSSWIGFQSNGLLLDTSRALKLIDAGLNRICLSLDAIDPDTFRKLRQGGEVSAVQDALTALREARDQRPEATLRVGVEFVVRRDNLHELPEVITWAAQQGADFAIVSQLMPYSVEQVEQRAYNDMSDEASALFRKWQQIASEQSLDIRDYPHTVWSSDRHKHRAIAGLVNQMKGEARDRQVFLNVQQLFSCDNQRPEQTALFFNRAHAAASRSGLELYLPSVEPRHERRCAFIEEGGAFVSWDGAIHPCYNLWHGYRCYIGDWERNVTPRAFGNVRQSGIFDIWNQTDFHDFRNNVLDHDYPYCSNCSVAPCDYLDGTGFEQDCFLSTEPCGSCLWSMGLLQCLR